jgi:hypothetical protein
MIQILVIAIISLLAQLVLPWWSIAIVALAVCYWRSSGVGNAFWYGFTGIALVWLVYALLIHVRTDGIFTGRMSQLLFKTDGSVVLILVSAVLGGLVGGLAGLSGYFIRQALVNQPSVRNA